MAEQENTTPDPLEEAFNAPAAEGHPEAESAENAEDAAEAVEAELQDAVEAELQDAVEAESADAALAAERLDSLLRLQAEFTNFKNRTAREKEQLRGFVTSELVTALLPVLDDIDAARKHGDLQEGPFASIATKLEELLGKQGVERFGEVGDAFDPNIHEAVLQQPTDEVAEDHVSMVLRYGYRVNDRVVRTAQVAVAVAP